MVKKEQISLRIPKETKEKLEKLAEATGRDRTFLATEALDQYCDTQAWQIEAIKEGIRDIENGNYIEHEELKKEWILKRENYLGRVSEA
ncbi:MAG: hypothetical protein A2Y25_06230 [Candidatus Melainabacteria bacterium GWF2_37_15]|nr:MAG: hypothetical protein A2Y25_06230 [Candidatus Melainabacteria bacterium GWF2_37_15]